MSETSLDYANQEPVTPTSPEPPKEEEQEEKSEEFKPYRVFINHVDSYNSKYIASYVTEQIYGLSRLKLPGIDEGLGEGDEAPPPQIPPEEMPTDKYEFIGSLTVDFRHPSEDFLYIVGEEEPRFREEILKCGFIIYDISKDPEEINKALKTLSILTEQLDEIQEIGPKTYENFKETKIFILISTIMTWALTKPLDPDDPDLPFSEVDYRKRRPHPNYKKHYNCEKEVIKIGKKYKDKLKTYILCTGHTYGEEEDSLEFFFKMAWYNEILPIFETGNNRVPFIHVRDLARAVHGLMENAPSKLQYILAVEQNPTTLKQFIKSLSKSMSDGKTVTVVAEEAFLYKNMTQQIFDISTVNLNMEPVFLVENLQMEWQSELTIAENMNQLVREFKAKKNLKPVKIVIHGPPASGKTQLAKKLCEYYNCKYVSIPTMLEDLIQIWKDDMARLEQPRLEEAEYLGEEEVEDEMEEEDNPQRILEQIREMQILMEGGIEKIPESYISGLLKSYLAKNLCQNRGYVLDDYPRTIPQAKELFGHSENEPGGEEEEAEVIDTGVILPQLVVSLVATDEFITNHLMILPEDAIKDTPNSEENIYQRLEVFRENNTEDNTVLNYFDELEVDILLVEVKDDEYEEEFQLAVAKAGPPSSFGLSLEEEAELYRLEAVERKLAEEKDELYKQMQLEKAEEDRKNKMEAWSEILEKLQMEEEKILVAQSEPLRHYLMKYIFPVLTKGLIEVATIKPDDPLDYLAEFLFKENPEGKMFDPSFNVECEDLYGEFRSYIEKIIEENEAFDK